MAGALLLLVLVFAAQATCDFAASLMARSGTVPGLQAAVRWAPGNAEYRYLLGRYYSLLGADFQAALREYQTAVRLNPHEAQYWVELATTYAITGDDNAQLAAIQSAVKADPTTPDVAWEAANLYLAHGDKDAALREFRVVMQNETVTSADRLQLCWRAFPDAQLLLRQVLPARTEAYLAFLDLLMTQKQTDAASQVWSALMGLHQPFEARYLFSYIHFLLGQRKAEKAQAGWQEGTALLGLSSYVPSATNLVVNPNFSLDVINGGFDWIYDIQDGVKLSLDSTQFHSGNRSLLIDFDNAGVNDAGIYQLVPVDPNTRYAVNAYYRTGEFSGAGGIRLTLQDFYTGQVYFQSDDMVNAAFWKSAAGAFTTGSDGRMVAVRLLRVPAGSPIRGKLWIGEVQLARAAAGAKP
jgi:hypothetical protein